MEFGYVKKHVKSLLEKATKYVSKKTLKKSAGKGFFNKPEDCCIISHCRCFTQVLNKEDIGKTIYD